LLHSELALSLERGTEFPFCYHYSNGRKKSREFSTLPEVGQFSFITQLARNVSSAAHDYISLRKVLVENDIIYLGYTDMRRLTTGIRSQKYVVRRFRRCANITECLGRGHSVVLKVKY